jgi:hypothetical protein
VKAIHFFSHLLLVAALVSNYTVVSIYCQNASSPQEVIIVTGEDLYKLLIYPEEGAVYSRARYFIRDTYAKELNNGEVPDWGTVYRLSELMKNYMAGHASELGQPAKTLLISALKEAPSRIKDERVYWDKAKGAAEQYFSEPTPENAEQLFLSLPENSKQIISFLDAKGEDILRDFIFDFSGEGRRRNLSILEKEIEAGEPYSVDVAFRLFNLTDGAYTESLCFILGELLVPNHPHLFLEKALIHEANIASTFFDPLECILRMDAEWGEIPEAGNDPEKYEQISQVRMERRIKAIESVADPRLKAIRDRCLSLLRKRDARS